MKEFKLVYSKRISNPCVGSDFIELSYENWTDGIRTEKFIQIPSPEVIRLNITEIELIELNKVNTTK